MPHSERSAQACYCNLTFSHTDTALSRNLTLQRSSVIFLDVSARARDFQTAPSPLCLFRGDQRAGRSAQTTAATVNFPAGSSLNQQWQTALGPTATAPDTAENRAAWGAPCRARVGRDRLQHRARPEGESQADTAPRLPTEHGRTRVDGSVPPDHLCTQTGGRGCARGRVSLQQQRL